MKFVLLFSQQHVNFRLAELRAICKSCNISLNFDQVNTEEHIFVVDFNTEDEVRRLLSRSMLLKTAYRHMFVSNGYESLHATIKENLDVFKVFNDYKKSFHVKVRPVGRKKGLDCLKNAQDFCEYLPLDDCPVSLNNPETAFSVLEEYEAEKSELPKRVFFCLLIGDGCSRLKTLYNLRDRAYIGNTTMDPELSFIQANIACVTPGSLVLDPFVGTGGLILPAAEFGGIVFGTEINYQVARGIGKSSRHDVKLLTEKESVRANFSQYGTSHRLASTMIADASQHDIWRNRPIFDAIVSDPPYGVREKGRKIGKKEKKEHWTLPSAEHAEHFPEKQKYTLESTFTDLCDLASKVLLLGGRVSFWFPVILESYSEDCLPYHPALLLVENCEQGLTRKTSRRLLTYEKVREPFSGERTTTAQNIFENGTFRDAVFVANKTVVRDNK